MISPKKFKIALSLLAKFRYNPPIAHDGMVCGDCRTTRRFLEESATFYRVKASDVLFPAVQ